MVQRFEMKRVCRTFLHFFCPEKKYAPNTGKTNDFLREDSAKQTNREFLNQQKEKIKKIYKESEGSEIPEAKEMDKLRLYIQKEKR